MFSLTRIVRTALLEANAEAIREAYAGNYVPFLEANAEAIHEAYVEALRKNRAIILTKPFVRALEDSIMLKIGSDLDGILRTEFTEILLNGVSSQKEEEARLSALLEKTYGFAGKRLAAHLKKIGKLRSGTETAIIHGYILRRCESAERLLAKLRPTKGDGVSTQKLTQLIIEILTEDGIEKKEATLKLVMSADLLPATIARNRAKADKKKQIPLNQRTTRTQSQIDAALTGSPWEGSIVASSAEIIPHGYIRLSVLVERGVKSHSLSNGLSSVLVRSGVEQIYILKAWYRDDLLKAAAMSTREPARSGLLEAIKNESIVLLEGGQGIS